MRKVMAVLLSAICLCGLVGCSNPYPYHGDYKELYTTAIYSIPDAQGYMHHGEGAYDPDIYIWEQDDYGRTMFAYCEDYGNQIFALVICQAYDEEKVYIYPESNYMLTMIDSEYVYEAVEKDYLKNKTQAFYLENSEKLKQANDWNQPVDKSKCISYPITDHKDLGEKVYSLSMIQCNKILDDYTQTLNLANPESGPHRYNNVLQVDAKGEKVLHEIYGLHRHYDNPNWEKSDESATYYIRLWVITDQKGNYDKELGILVMYSGEADNSDTSFIYSAEDIREFKDKNGWSYGN